MPGFDAELKDVGIGSLGEGEATRPVCRISLASAAGDPLELWGRLSRLKGKRVHVLVDLDKGDQPGLPFGEPEHSEDETVPSDLHREAGASASEAGDD